MLVMRDGMRPVKVLYAEKLIGKGDALFTFCGDCD